jgi:hypothetical protein
VVGANLAWGAHEKVLATGDAMGWTFEQPGIYPYSCMIHPGMTGAIIVGDAAVAGTPSAPESSAAPPSVAERPFPAAASVAAGAAAIALAAAWLLLRRRSQTPV